MSASLFEKLDQARAETAARIEAERQAGKNADLVRKYHAFSGEKFARSDAEAHLHLIVQYANAKLGSPEDAAARKVIVMVDALSSAIRRSALEGVQWWTANSKAFLESVEDLDGDVLSGNTLWDLAYTMFHGKREAKLG